LALPARAAAVVAENMVSLFKKSPSAAQFPKASFEAEAPSLWRGIRSTDQFEIRPNGDLVLNPGTNFGGKTTGISFTDNQDVAWRYATRQPETPVPSPDGVVFRIRRDIFEDELKNAFGYPVGHKATKKPKLKYEGIEGEHAHYTNKPFIVPKGSWEAKTPEKNIVEAARRKLEQRVEKYYNMDDKSFMKRYGDQRSILELEEHTGGIDVFGFDSIGARSMQAKHSDAIEQVLFHTTGGTEDFPMEIALRAKIAAVPDTKQKEYVRLLSRYADESDVSYLYGPDWFYDEWFGITRF
jgi:hypothetical protein